MALTDAQIVDIRRYAGYAAALGGDLAIYSDPIYSHAGPTWGLNRLTLAEKLDGLTSAEEVVLTDTFLVQLATFEAAIPTAAANLDTQAAGPWIANPREIAQRKSLFNDQRRDMCAFLGIPPGPALGSGGVTLVRA